MIARPPCSLDPGHGRPERTPQADALGDEQHNNVAAFVSDLLTDDHFEPHPACLSHRAGRLCSVNAFVIGDGDDVQRGAVLSLVEDRCATLDTPSEASEWMWRSARPISFLPLRVPAVLGCRPIYWKASVHHCSRGVSDDSLKDIDLIGHEARHALLRRADGGQVEAVDACRVVGSGAPRCDDPGWSAGLESENGRSRRAGAPPTLKFYASVQLDVRRIGQVKDKDETVGNQTRVKVVKNKVAPPFRVVEFDIMYGEGVSKTGELIDLGIRAGVVEKSGSWFSWNSQRIGQGRENAKTFLKEHPEVAGEIERTIRSNAGVASGGAGLNLLDQDLTVEE